jgi:hypothetical protein
MKTLVVTGWFAFASLFFCSPHLCGALPSPWQSTDVGNPLIAGNSSHSAGEFVVTGAGADVFGTSDQFQYCYRDWTGDFDISTKVTALKDPMVDPQTNGGGTHGLMVRESLDAGARHVTFFIQPSRPMAPLLFTSRRLLTGASTVRQGDSAIDATPEYWLRLVRTGDNLACYHSNDGFFWTPFVKGNTSLPGLASSVKVGLAVCSRTSNAASWARFKDLKIETPAWSYRTSWLGNTIGGGTSTVPGQVQTLYFDRTDQSLYLASEYEESGRSVTRYSSDGDLLAIMEGVQFKGGRAVTADASYVYFGSRSDKNQGNYGVRRFNKDGTPANFGGSSNLLVLNASSENKTYQIQGLAVNRSLGELYAAVPAYGGSADRIVVIRTSDMTVLSGRTFNFQRPGAMAVDAAGDLWIIRRNDTANLSGGLFKYSRSGQLLAGVEGLDDPRGIAIDASGRVCVTLRGTSHKVLLFNPDNLANPTSFGPHGGIFSGRRGEVGPMKLNNPVGVGVDDSGNFYIASNGNDDRPQFEVRKLSATGEQIWERLGLEFLDAADADPATDAREVLTKHHRYVMDWSQPAGREWKYAGYTLDAKSYPDDPRLFVHNIGGVQIRRIAGKKFMFVHQMYSRWLCVYRFENDSEIAIPCVIFVHQNTKTVKEAWPSTQPNSGRWIWTDTDHDGRIEAGEFASDGPDDTLLWGWWVDTEGNVWTTSRANGIRRYAMLGLDSSGKNPRYSPASISNYPVPTDFTSACRAIYLPANDTMVISGFTTELPWDDRYGQGPFGTSIAKYTNWSNAASRTKMWQFETEFYVPKSDNSGFDNAPKSWAANEDFLYYSDIDFGSIDVHEMTGGEYVKTLIPGPEVNGTTGMIDIPHAMNAWKRANGEQLLFVEEDARCKNIVYREASRRIYTETFDATTSPFVIDVNGQGTLGTQVIGGNRAAILSDLGTSSDAATVFRMRLGAGNPLLDRINAVFAADPATQEPVTFLYSFRLERTQASSSPIASSIKASIQLNNYDGVNVPRFPTGEPVIFNTVAYQAREATSPVLQTVDANDPATITYRFTIRPNGGVRTASSLDFRFHLRVSQGATPETIALDDLSVSEVAN